MDRTTYQKEIERFIWVHDQQAMDYISLQLVSEVGELLGGYAKRLVGRDISDEYLALEAGDICFFLAWLCQIKGFNFSNLMSRIPQYEKWVEIADEMADDAAALVYFANEDVPSPRYLVHSLEAMLGWAIKLCPVSLEEALQMNIDKLEVRHAARVSNTN